MLSVESMKFQLRYVSDLEDPFDVDALSEVVFHSLDPKGFLDLEDLITASGAPHSVRPM